MLGRPSIMRDHPQGWGKAPWSVYWALSATDPSFLLETRRAGGGSSPRDTRSRWKMVLSASCITHQQLACHSRAGHHRPRKAQSGRALPSGV